ncbi:MAG: transposase [Atopobiaceae bacterium]|nr:transposase [Atopobiaceae bacterium]
MASQTTQELALARLDDAIGRVCSVPEACARDPGRDFTRSRKLPLPKLVRLMVTWGGDTIPVELNDAFGWDGGAPTASAFCQQRAKLRDDVMPRVNEAFLGMWGHVPFGDGYRLLGVDGTSVALPGSDDPRTRVRSNQGSAERNEAHPSILYDISRRTFEDMVWQGAKEQDEPGAFCELVDRLPPAEGADGLALVPLVLADRNYCTYNALSHLIEAGCSFCLRARDCWVEGFLGEGKVPEGEFDLEEERVFVRTRSLAARTRPDEPEAYRRIKSTTRLDALPSGGRGEWALRVRGVRARVPAHDEDPDQGDAWMNLVTDNPEDEMGAGDLPSLYMMRWEHEVSYGHLKNVCGLRDPRTRDYDRARMEVWGRLILFNVCSLGTRDALASSHAGRRLRRAPDLKTSFKGMRRAMRGVVVDLAAVASRCTHSVPPAGRRYPRRRRNRSPAKLGHRCC